MAIFDNPKLVNSQPYKLSNQQAKLLVSFVVDARSFSIEKFTILSPSINHFTVGLLS